MPSLIARTKQRANGDGAANSGSHERFSKLIGNEDGRAPTLARAVPFTSQPRLSTPKQPPRRLSSIISFSFPAEAAIDRVKGKYAEQPSEIYTSSYTYADRLLKYS